jgi:hypothetical protein
VIDSVVAGLRSETGAMANARIVPIEKLIEKQHNLSADDVRGIVDAAISAEREKQRHDRDQAIAAAVEEARRADKADIADLEQRLRDTAGEAPQVRTWSPSTVFYRGQYVTYAGALYQLVAMSRRRQCRDRTIGCVSLAPAVTTKMGDRSSSAARTYARSLQRAGCRRV